MSNKLSVDPIDLSKWQPCCLLSLSCISVLNDFDENIVRRKMPHSKRQNNYIFIIWQNRNWHILCRWYKAIENDCRTISLCMWRGNGKKANSIDNCYHKTELRFNMQEVAVNVKQYTRETWWAGEVGATKPSYLDLIALCLGKYLVFYFVRKRD